MNLRPSCFPKSRTENALAAERCIYSVSLGHVEPRARTILEGYAWTAKRYRQVVVYVGDSPLIDISLRTQGFSEREAIDRGRRISEEAIANLNAIAPVRSLSTASELCLRSTFQSKKAAIAAAFSADAALEHTVRHDAECYVRRLSRQGRLGMPEPEALLLGIDYILFELAVYAHFAEANYWVDVYAGEELATLKNFARHRLNGFPELERRACISLKQ
jgi:tRNA-dependent cyclodipeptide synthase